MPTRLAPIACLLVLVVARTPAEEVSLFAPSNLTTASGERADPDSFFPAADCGECHVGQFAQWDGSLHSRAHVDGIYLAFARQARKEGGEALYRFCSGCHAPGAVATGEIPGTPDDKLSFLGNEGVTCDICHSVKEFRAHHHGGGSNASIVLDEGDARYGPLKDAGANPVHESIYSELHTRAELCSNCHTLIHPHNGLVIENTYQEWKESPYAKAGIQCQDCHMRTPEQAAEVARTMRPLAVPGRAVQDGEERANVHAHYFVGANTNAQLTRSSAKHGSLAEQRLKGAATLALRVPDEAAPGTGATVEVAVTNVGAGHAIPTSITELRQVWIDLQVTDASGRVVFRSGAVDGDGRVDPEAVMYHAVLVDEQGEVTYLPWRAHRMLEEKLLPPRETVRERYEVPLPAEAKGPFAVRAVLRYRSAPQEVMDELYGRGTYPIAIVDMAEASATLGGG